MEYLEENEELQLYKRYILKKLKDKKHILSEEMEAVLAKVSEIAKGPENIFSMFNNADVDFGKIADAEVQIGFSDTWKLCFFFRSPQMYGCVRKPSCCHVCPV